MLIVASNEWHPKTKQVWFLTWVENVVPAVQLIELISHRVSSAVPRVLGRILLGGC